MQRKPVNLRARHFEHPAAAAVDLHVTNLHYYTPAELLAVIEALKPACCTDEVKVRSCKRMRQIVRILAAEDTKGC